MVRGVLLQDAQLPFLEVEFAVDIDEQPAQFTYCRVDVVDRLLPGRWKMAFDIRNGSFQKRGRMGLFRNKRGGGPFLNSLEIIQKTLLLKLPVGHSRGVR